MVAIRRPSSRAIAELLASDRRELSYPEVGSSAQLGSPGTLETLSSRYRVDRYEFTLGRGRSLFERAASSLLAWRHFEIPWLELHRQGPVRPGQVVATLTRVAGLWFLNPSRVVYAEQEPLRDSAAFAYGTLRGHAVCGEERFQVRFDRACEAVVYTIAAFSRPAIALTRLGLPLARRIQRRFARSSAEALARASAA